MGERRYLKPALRRTDEGELEYRCDDCSDRGNASYWPVTEDFWNYNRSFTRCRACWRVYDRRRIAESRTDPAYREQERQYAKAYWDAMSIEERRAIYSKKRAYHREWMRAYRARKKAAA